jgi:hypothetical protein
VPEEKCPGDCASNVVLTVDYEQARGLREPGGKRDGTFSISASKTIAVPSQRVFEAFANPKLRERWLPHVDVRERKRQQGKHCGTTGKPTTRES